MAKNIRNFDAFISELKRETIPFTIFGKTYEIEKRMPAIIPLELSKYDDEDNIPPKVLFRAARNIFGDKILNELSANPAFSIDVLTELIKWAFEAINGAAAAEPVALTEDDTAAPERKN